MSLVGRATLSLLLIFALALAGCSSSDSGGGGGGSGTTTTKTTTGKTTTTKSTTSTSSSGGGGGGGKGGNHAPVGTIRASIEKGPIPVRVNFTLTGTDQDGDDLTWNIDVNGDGRTDQSGDKLPATVSHNYTATGKYNVTYSLSDGTDTSTYHVTINATAAANGAGPVTVLSGDYLAGTPDVCAIGGPEFTGGGSVGINQVNFDPAPELLGKHFKAKWEGVQAPANTYNVQFLSKPDPTTNTVSDLGDFSSTTPSLEGDIPAADLGNMVSSSCLGAGNPITVTWEIG